MKVVWALIFIVFASESLADMVVATRTIRAKAVISASDLDIRASDMTGVFSRIEDVVGQEARVALYPGRPIRFDDIGPPAIIERNQIVTLTYNKGGLIITADARSLNRGGVGDRIRVMNLASRNTVFGFVEPDGSIVVNSQR